ncbi:unnamed protein product [Rangifer tarandus platyrhynchus]|uniref:Uncharacterized protein n=2 Tax=Rangifer tarandus platyrhynchus TaxID=3082113 RepID=A0ACB0EMD5_RANTA|nr:unnamed protein product [Rangifer tarandus platyrhynchus]CAI9701713.1 unnamed protein product [Rangifer tarandus platyrhynchus]
MSYERHRCLGPEADWKRSTLVNARCPEHLARCPAQTKQMLWLHPVLIIVSLGWPGPETRLNQGLRLSEAHDAYTGSTLDLCKCRGRICLSTPSL